jgi:exosortase/archaeosortase family protein
MVLLGWRGMARDVRSDWRQRWVAAAPTTRAIVQTTVLVGAVLYAYHYSLLSLAKNVGLDTPLAYLGLVPCIALGLAAIHHRPATPEPSIHDRQVDYIVGLPLLAAALAINLLLPHRLSAMFWVWRIDLLSLPLFVAGTVSIIFGVRALWRQRLAVGYLLLAWPLPYTAFLLKLLTSFTNFTLAALKDVLHVVPVGTPIGGTSNSVFQIVHNGKPFPISVVSACSGVNGMVGFLLVGAAFIATVTGPRLLKSLWLLGGLFLLWAINLGRLVLIFWAGTTFGESFALKVLHPFVGLLTFNLGIVLMILVLRPLGLRFAMPIRSRRKRENEPAGDSPESGGPSLPFGGPGGLAVPRVFGAIAVVVVVGGVLGFTNSQFRAYDLVATATGEPKLASYLTNPAAPLGWRPVRTAEFDWAKAYFGQSSQWLRYTYLPQPLAGGDLFSSVPVTADVINTSDLQSFSAYGVEACYRFHGYSLRDLARVDLGAGISGEALSYSSKRGDWTIVYWIWPVKDGTHTHYERVILYMINTAGASLKTPPAVGVKGVSGALSGTSKVEKQLLSVRSFLVNFAREVVRGQTKIVPGSRLPVRHYGPRPVVPPTTDNVTVKR